jgi:hypothetical protein
MLSHDKKGFTMHLSYVLENRMVSGGFILAMGTSKNSYSHNYGESFQLSAFQFYMAGETLRDGANGFSSQVPSNKESSIMERDTACKNYKDVGLASCCNSLLQ